jgi:subtilisin family serine protease
MPITLIVDYFVVRGLYAPSSNTSGAMPNTSQALRIVVRVYAVWKDAVETAIRRAPDTLFVCAAGNSNSNASFIGDVPASLHLPNLITVGAVDQAGKETNFTSYGDTVVLDADGYEVESLLPGSRGPIAPRHTRK